MTGRMKGKESIDSTLWQPSAFYSCGLWVSLRYKELLASALNLIGDTWALPLSWVVAGL